MDRDAIGTRPGPEAGKWRVSVDYQEHSPSCQVAVSANPTEHNLLIQVNGSMVVLVEENETPAATGAKPGGAGPPTVAPAGARAVPPASSRRIDLPLKKPAAVVRRRGPSPPVRPR